MQTVLDALTFMSISFIAISQTLSNLCSPLTDGQSKIISSAYKNNRHTYVTNIASSITFYDFITAHQDSLLKRCISYRKSVRPSVCLSVRPSVRPSHAGTVSKRLKLRSWGLHCRIAPWLVSSRLPSARNSKGNLGSEAPNERGVGKIVNF